MGSAPTWLRQVSPPASQNHFNHCRQPKTRFQHWMVLDGFRLYGLSYCAGRRLQIDGYLRRQRLSRGPAADDCCWRAKNTLATNCCLFWARFYGNHLLCIYVGIKILYLASAILQVSDFELQYTRTESQKYRFCPFPAPMVPSLAFGGLRCPILST